VAFGRGVGAEVLGYGGGADGFAGEPADALEGEDGLGAVGDGFFLGLGGLVSEVWVGRFGLSDAVLSGGGLRWMGEVEHVNV